MTDERHLMKIGRAVPAGLILALFMGTLLISGCALADDKAPSGDLVLTVASASEPKSIDPTVDSSPLTRLGITETLIGVDSEGRLSPMLAKSWNVSDDCLTWTLALRDDVKFHDGTPFTADAAKASLERTFRKATEFMSVKTMPVKSISVAGKNAISITTTRPFAPLIGYLAKGASSIMAESSLNEKDEVVKPVGTGPFMFDSWVPKERITSVKFGDYWGTRPRLDRVIYLAVPDEKTRESMLKAGEADIITTLSPALAQRLNKDSSATVYTQTKMGRVRHIMLNTNKTPLDDVNVRRAISLAVDRDLICTSILEGIDKPAASPFSPELYWADRDLKLPSYDPEKARSVLDGAGWTDTDGDGVREKDGKKLELSLFTYTMRPELPSIAEALKDQLGKVGIKVDITILEDSAIREQAKGGKVDMYLVSIGTLLNNDPDSWASYFQPDSTYFNCINYAPKDVAGLIQKGRETMDTGDRKEIYDQLQEKILEDAPVVYLTYYTGITASRADVHGYKEDLTDYVYHLENVYKE